MEFEKLVGQLDQLNLPNDQYVVVGSGAMAARGIREANDFDILVTMELWDKLAKENTVVMSGQTENIEFGKIQILGNGSMYRKPEFASLDEMLRTADVVKGHRFLNLELVKKFKLNEGRDKDLRDVELIDKYLRDSSLRSE